MLGESARPARAAFVRFQDTQLRIVIVQTRPGMRPKSRPDSMEPGEILKSGATRSVTANLLPLMLTVGP